MVHTFRLLPFFYNFSFLIHINNISFVSLFTGKSYPIANIPLVSSKRKYIFESKTLEDILQYFHSFYIIVLGIRICLPQI